MFHRVCRYACFNATHVWSNVNFSTDPNRPVRGSLSDEKTKAKGMNEVIRIGHFGLRVAFIPAIRQQTTDWCFHYVQLFTLWISFTVMKSCARICVVQKRKWFGKMCAQRCIDCANILSKFRGNDGSFSQGTIFTVLLDSPSNEERSHSE